MRAAVAWFEAIILGVVLCLGAACMGSFILILSTDIISYTEEKSALDTDDAVSEPQADRYGRDLLASLVNTDEFAPYPNAIRIDGSPVLKLDNTFVVMKFVNLAEVYSSSGPYKLSTKLDKKIQAVLFETYDGVECFHYYITTNPPVMP